MLDRGKEQVIMSFLLSSSLREYHHVMITPFKGVSPVSTLLGGVAANMLVLHFRQRLEDSKL
jgi:hypothetical protein